MRCHDSVEQIRDLEQTFVQLFRGYQGRIACVRVRRGDAARTRPRGTYDGGVPVR